VVLGTTGPPPAYESDAVARAEAEARRSEPGAGPAPAREPDTVRSDLLDDPDVRRSGPIRFGLVVLAAILVAALLLFLV
jgi:hypothetical protein